MRKHARKDDNQDEIRSLIHQLGGTTLVTHQLGDGAPDVIAGTDGLTIIGRMSARQRSQIIDLVDSWGYSFFNGANVMVEIKDGEKPPSKQKLTSDEEKWHKDWKGQICIWRSDEEVIEALGF